MAFKCKSVRYIIEEGSICYVVEYTTIKDPMYKRRKTVECNGEVIGAWRTNINPSFAEACATIKNSLKQVKEQV